MAAHPDTGLRGLRWGDADCVVRDMNQNATAFGAFGTVIALFAYILIGTTLSLVCAVFAPVRAEWREGEKDRKDQGPAGTPC